MILIRHEDQQEDGRHLGEEDQLSQKSFETLEMKNNLIFCRGNENPTFVKGQQSSLEERSYQECNLISKSGNEDHKLMLRADPVLLTHKIRIFDCLPFIFDNWHSMEWGPDRGRTDFQSIEGRTSEYEFSCILCFHKPWFSLIIASDRRLARKYSHSHALFWN